MLINISIAPTPKAHSVVFQHRNFKTVSLLSSLLLASTANAKSY